MGFFDLISGGNKTPKVHGDKIITSDEIKNDKRIQKVYVTDGSTGKETKMSRIKYKNRTVETRSYDNED